MFARTSKMSCSESVSDEISAMSCVVCSSCLCICSSKLCSCSFWSGVNRASKELVPVSIAALRTSIQQDHLAMTELAMLHQSAETADAMSSMHIFPIMIAAFHQTGCQSRQSHRQKTGKCCTLLCWSNSLLWCHSNEVAITTVVD